MVGSLSDYAENKILNHVFGKEAYEIPDIYVALCTAAPTDASTGSNIVEPTTGGYARLATDTDDWNSASGGILSNASTLTFPAATAAQGTITHFALCDALTGGNVIGWGEVTPNVPIVSASIASFDAGNLTVSIN